MAAIEFDGVWKKFHRGEQHDSLRDLIPSMVKRALGRSHKDDLDKDDFWVLRDVSFKVERGEALGIIGQNGAGKSTTLKLLTRILKPTRGSCHVRGRVGALIEVAAGFHQDLTGRENVFLQGAIMGMRREDIRRRFDDIVSFASLGDFIDTPVKRYSSGMNARLGFSIAAHLEPDVLLIDEVLAVGDFTFQQRCYERLREFRKTGVTIAFVSHNMQAIASLCDNAVLLRPGLPPFVGNTGEAIAAYTSASQGPVDSRIMVRRSSLRDHRGTAGTMASPGDALSLDVDIEPRIELPRCIVGFEVVRADGTVMFNSGPNLEGDRSYTVAAGESLSVGIAFRANLLRGVYQVNLHLMDEHRHWTPITVPHIASFAVHETTRVAGCAELEPVYRVVHHARDRQTRVAQI
jgi:lipopolysaccharide transport system ATP-binding protein